MHCPPHVQVWEAVVPSEVARYMGYLDQPQLVAICSYMVA